MALLSSIQTPLETEDSLGNCSWHSNKYLNSTCHNKFIHVFHLHKRPQRVDFPAQNTILSTQKAPACRFSGPKHNLICPKGPCRTLFQLEIQFDPPKRPLQDAFLTQNTIFICPPAACFSGSKYNLICPKGLCGVTSVTPKAKDMTLDQNSIRNLFRHQNVIFVL